MGYVSRCLALLCLLSGCYYDVDDIDDLGVADLRVLVVDFNGDGGVCPNGSKPAHSGELAEGNASGESGWGAATIPADEDMKSATVVLDSTHVVAGASSLRLDTNASAAGLFYPDTRAASFDVSEQLYVSFSITADDSSTKNDPGWQGGQPHLLVVSTSDDYYEYIPSSNRLPRSPGELVGITVPLAGGDGWTRNVTGAPDLRNVRYLAWTFTTWGAGFTIWLDDVQVGPEPFLDCP